MRFDQAIFPPALGASIRLLGLLGALLVALPGCGTELKPERSQCAEDGECATGICACGVCVTDADDTDGDQLFDWVECDARVGTDPVRSDSDGDGDPDGIEIGPSPESPLDCDGDGVANALESALDDQDGDGVPDEFDAVEGPFCEDESRPEPKSQSSDGCVNYECPAPCAPDDISCDGIDDDCDGSMDEDYAPESCSTGQCQAFTACEGGQVTTCTPLPPQAEDQERACDGLDNDCDGEVDEAAAASAAECGVGRCATRTECVDAQWACPEVPHPEEDNDCNGLNDDCDVDAEGNELVDEDYVGAECGVGACAGVMHCGEDGVEVCVGPDPLPADPSCNGVDEDCDGEVDEDFVAEVPGWRCELGEEVCTRSADLDLLCDGVDEDCDGQVDEDFVGSACGVGACASVTTCAGGEERCIEVPAGPSDVTCDGVDTDCDGETDEGFIGRGCGVGACAGTTVCEAGATECEGPAAAAADLSCDGVDDDCDGEPDEDFVSPIGGWTCVGGQESCDPLEGDDTTCDSIDDDCDRSLDEAFVAAARCRVGEGACESDEVCLEGQVQCPEIEHPDEDTVCDGIDEDCDGSTDEEYVSVLCEENGCDGFSGCIDGEVMCGVQREPEDGEATVCDGQDNDCDGLFDEEFEPAPCHLAEFGGCERRTRCGDQPGGGGVGIYCPAPEDGADPQIETECDGLDADCDGSFDENYLSFGCGVGACAGFIRCNAGAEACDGDEPAAADITCDAEDDDCDGSNDENFVSELGGWVCTEGEETCEVIDAADALCDGVDEDCDGLIDEGYVGVACGVGACGAQTRCEGAEVICPVIEPSCPPEDCDGLDACDGVDDDCDGSIDEHWVPNQCEVEGFAELCVGKRYCEDVGEGVYEVVCRQEPLDLSCDGIDSDCDGAVDEDYVSRRCEQDGCDSRTYCQESEELCNEATLVCGDGHIVFGGVGGGFGVQGNQIQGSGCGQTIFVPTPFGAPIAMPIHANLDNGTWELDSVSNWPSVEAVEPDAVSLTLTGFNLVEENTCDWMTPANPPDPIVSMGYEDGRGELLIDGRVEVVFSNLRMNIMHEQLGFDTYHFGVISGDAAPGDDRETELWEDLGGDKAVFLVDRFQPAANAGGSCDQPIPWRMSMELLMNKQVGPPAVPGFELHPSGVNLNGAVREEENGPMNPTEGRYMWSLEAEGETRQLIQVPADASAWSVDYGLFRSGEEQGQFEVTWSSCAVDAPSNTQSLATVAFEGHEWVENEGEGADRSYSGMHSLGPLDLGTPGRVGVLKIVVSDAPFGSGVVLDNSRLSAPAP